MLQTPKDKTPNFETLINRLSDNGFRFSRFEICCEDPCDPVDVEWNYKDMAHVEFVHSHVYREFVYIGQNTYSTIDIQKLFGISVPQSATFYTTKDNKLVAHTTLLVFVVLVEVGFELAGPLRTKTTTRYAVGTKSILGRLLFPLIRYGLTRNWKLFTQDDRPLRRRRGELRAKGYDFSDTSPVDLRHTLNIAKQGIFSEKVAVLDGVFEIEVNDISESPYYWGEDDHFGLLLKRNGDQIQIFPRLCPHRGGSLDKGDLNSSSLTCPWHGRQIKPVCSISVSSYPVEYRGPFHILNFDGIYIRIEASAQSTSNDASGEKFPADWTSAWTANFQ